MRIRNVVGVAVGVALLLAAGCTASLQPVAISRGETCFRCQRTIANERIAAEILDQSGQAKKFRTVGCLATYLAGEAGDVPNIYVTDYASGKLVRAGTANYVRTVIDTTTNERDYLAFASFAQALKYSHDNKLQKPIDWSAVEVSVSSAN